MDGDDHLPVEGPSVFVAGPTNTFILVRVSDQAEILTVTGQESMIAATLPQDILILIIEHGHQRDLSDEWFWTNRRRLLRSMVRVNKHWNAALGTELYRVIELRDLNSMVSLLYSLLHYPSFRGLVRALKMDWLCFYPIEGTLVQMQRRQHMEKAQRILELLPLLTNLYYLEICHNWREPHAGTLWVADIIYTLTGLEDLSNLKPVELPELRYLVLRGHHPFFSRLVPGLLHQLYALQCPWAWDMDNGPPQVLCPSLSQAVLNFRRCTSKLAVNPPLPLGHNLHTLSLAWITPSCLPLSALREVVVANASTLRLLRALPMVSGVDWPELNQEIARLLPILENLERLHVDMTVRNGDFTALHCLLESMPKSYQMLEMTDMGFSLMWPQLGPRLVDFLAAAPGIKPKELMIHGVGHSRAEWLRRLINEKLDIPFRWTRTHSLDESSFDVDSTWTCNM